MNEASRLQMLAAIGIAPLVPRFALAGAKPSPQCELDDLAIAALMPEPGPPPVAARPAQPAAASAEKPVRAKSPRIEMDAEPARQDSVRQTATAKTQSRADSAAPRLQVNLIQHHARCFSLLPVYKPEFQAEAEQFLRAVMLSLGIASAPLATQAFRWPFANNAKLDLGPAALREALAGFVHHAAREPDSVVLLWGLDVARHLREDPINQPGAFALSPTLGAIAAHRVQDYFNEPRRKRDLWQQLSAVKSVLRGNEGI